MSSSLLHRQLGHVREQYLKLMCTKGTVDVGVVVDDRDMCKCETCLLSEGLKIPHNHTRSRAKRHLENLHVDLSGIMRTHGLKNESYYIWFTDNYTLYCHIYPLITKSKEEVHEVFRYYISRAERQTGCSIKTLTLDRGGETVNNLLGGDLKDLGIDIHLTAGHTPAQNSVAKRGNHTIGTKARSMMLESGLPLKFWYQACSTAVFLTNRTVTKAVPDSVTLFEKWHFRRPSLNHLRVFGCQSFRLIKKELRDFKCQRLEINLHFSGLGTSVHTLRSTSFLILVCIAAFQSCLSGDLTAILYVGDWLVAAGCARRLPYRDGCLRTRCGR